MTPRGTQRVSIPRSKYRDYVNVAENFSAGGEVAKTFEYWNAAGVLLIHAAIAYTDALTIKVGGVKSQGEDHMAAVDLVRAVVVLDDQGKKALSHLWRMIQEKSLISYHGEIYTKEDIEKLWKHLERYKAWIVPQLSQ